jgi:predicted ester cyclase
VYKDEIPGPMQAFVATKESEEQNKRVVTRFIEEMWNQRKLELAEELISHDCVTHQLRANEPAAGRPGSPDSVRREAAAWLAGFPDLTMSLEQLVASGNLVVSRCTMRGIHLGTWMGLAHREPGELSDRNYSPPR